MLFDDQRVEPKLDVESRQALCGLPKISVITVCRNNAQTIGQAIDSINTQTYSKVEHIFIDGASSDDTCRIITTKAIRQCKLVSEPDQGIYDAINKGIALASGDVIGILHADDFLQDSKVLADVAELFQDPSVDSVYGDLEYVDRHNIDHVVRHWKTKPFSKGRLARGWMPPHPTLYLRKSWYERCGDYKQFYTISADYLYILKLFLHDDFRSAYVPRVLVKMRTGGVSNRSLRNIAAKTRQDYRVLKEIGYGGMKTVALKNLRKIRQLF